jgi:hypothetical protein
MSGDHRGITNPERALWQTVLLQAIEEALNGPKNATKAQRDQMWQEARDYITTPSNDLAMVCALAGVEADAVVERMRSRTGFEKRK